RLGNWFKTLWFTFVVREVRRMPWESLLTMAARKFQAHERLLVYRRMDGLAGRPDPVWPDSLTALFVESAPGTLWSVYDFAREFKAIETYLGGVAVTRLTNPSLEELRAHVRKTGPAIVHLSGIDGYQGFELLKEPIEPPPEPAPAPANDVKESP